MCSKLTTMEHMEVEESPCAITTSHSSSRLCPKQHKRVRGKHTHSYVTIPIEYTPPSVPGQTETIQELQSVIARLEMEEQRINSLPATLEEKKAVLEKLRERATVLEESLQLARAALLSYLC